MCNRKTFLFAFVILAIYGLAMALGANAAGYFWCPDLDDNGYVDFHDYTEFAANWQQNGYCVHGDFDDNKIVDFNDMAIFASYWLAAVIDDGNCPCAKSVGPMSSSAKESQTSGCGCGSAKKTSVKSAAPLTVKPKTRFVPGEVIVCFKPEVARSSIYDLATNFNCSVIRKLQRRNVYILKIPIDKTEEQVIELLKKRPDVIYAERHAYVYPDGQLIPNDPNFHCQWNLHQDSDADVDAPEGWYEINQKFGRVGDPNIVIAIIDTGVDYNHPDLAADMWTDSVGNFGYDFVNSDYDPMDDSGHGTHVAGIAAAVTNNSIGVAGVAWGCKIMAIKVLPCTGPGCYADVADAIDYAVANGANVINMSFGTDYNSVLIRNAVKDAYDANLVLVAAAGNDANSLDVIEHYPSGYPEVICVSATDSNDQLASYSNYGSDVDFAAPGGDIMTEHTNCWWLAPKVTTCDKQIYSTMWNDTYAFMRGTSMAAPHVSGLAALCLSTCPKLSPQKVKECIINGVDDLGPPGKDDYYGWGRINVGRTFDYNVCDTNYFCADWSDSLGSAPSCAKLIKVSDGCWMGAFEYGQKAGEFVVLTYHICCGWHGWYGSSSCDYSNEPISGKTWSKSLSCNGGFVQLTDSTGAWQKITFTPTVIPEDCCIVCPCVYGNQIPQCYQANKTPQKIILTFNGVRKCSDSSLFNFNGKPICFNLSGNEDGRCAYGAWDIDELGDVSYAPYWYLENEDSPVWEIDCLYYINDAVVMNEAVRHPYYTCILNHTSNTDNKPGSGANWQTYWRKEIRSMIQACSIDYPFKRLFSRTLTNPSLCMTIITNAITQEMCGTNGGDGWYEAGFGCMNMSAVGYGGSVTITHTCDECLGEIWIISHSYIVDDVVKLEGSSTVCYKCILAHTSDDSNKPPNPTYWEVYP